MKKLFLLALACSLFAVGTTNAQNENYYGGQKGSWAITVGADPVIDFVGNMFNGTQRNYLYNLGASLSGKYFMSDKFAVTAGVRFSNRKDKEYSFDNPEDKNFEEVTSTNIQNAFRNFQLNVGAQYYFRPGKRFQPFIGAVIAYGRNNTYNYSKGYEYKVNGEIIQYDGYLKESSPTNTFSCLANVGIEYFLGKNVSISAALDLGVETSTNKSVAKFDTEDPSVTKEYVNEQNYKIKNSTTTIFGTGLMNGNIAFNFYF